MNQKTKELYEARARVLKALAHPTRLLIVDELLQQERNVAELTKMVGADMSTVSKHLTVLKNVGIIRDDKRGSQVYYQLAVRCVPNFFGCIESVLQSNAREHLSFVELKIR